MNHVRSSSFFLLYLFLLTTSCATAPKKEKFLSSDSPETLFAAICSVGKQIESVHGSVWLKTQSPEVSGQFFADITVPSASEVQLEVTNLFGGVEARVKVDQDHFEIHKANKSELKQGERYHSWGGIPLEWASNLFLGRVPCPKHVEDAELKKGDHGELIVHFSEKEDVPEQTFTYELTRVYEHTWVKELKWVRIGHQSVSVEFKFEDPEEESLSPRKWEAHSSEGSLKMRWRNRSVKWLKDSTSP